jgi:hypothetical protein
VLDDDGDYYAYWYIGGGWHYASLY